MRRTDLSARLRPLWLRFRLPFLSAFFSGLLAHGFFLTNKIPVDDDLPFFFGKGATTISGRWGLELLRFVLPDLSLPWLYGLLSLLLLSVCACLIVHIFAVRSAFLQLLLSALFITFPAETGILSYTFTTLPYAIALLLAVAAVAFLRRGGRLRWTAAPLALLLSCSVYQGYFAFAPAFCVILLLQALLKSDRPVGLLIRDGVEMLLALLLGAGLYGLSILLMGRGLQLPVLTADVVDTERSLLFRFALTYSAFLHTLTRGYFGYVRGPVSQVCHAALLVLTLGGVLRALKNRPLSRWLLCLLGLALLPPAAYCLYLLADTSYIHSLSLYSFFSVYVLCAVVLDTEEPFSLRLRPFAAAALSVVLIGNVYFANAFSLCSYLEAEQAKSFYTGLITRVQATPGYDESCSLALFGDPQLLRTDLRERFDLGRFLLPGNNISRGIHAPEILRLYLGWDVPMADEAELAALRDSGLPADMPVYPCDGSVLRTGDVVVVRLG